MFKNLLLKLFTFLALMLFSIKAFSQEPCLTDVILKKQIKADPSIKTRMDAFKLQHKSNTLSNTPFSLTGVINIPVVVHVVYNTPEQNISDEQIFSQIEVLNEDFRRLNANADNVWSQAADVEITFSLATRDQSGNATCGITRTQTHITAFDPTTILGQNMIRRTIDGGKDAWANEEYLNIWVGNLQGSIRGYAPYPGYTIPEYDGAVVDYQSFGRIGNLTPNHDQGRTATHEVGHWLGLRHIWGEGFYSMQTQCTLDDDIADTPNAGSPSYGCDISKQTCGSTDMVQNYMDYSFDACMNLFTQGQKTWMRDALAYYRPKILTSTGDDPPLDCNVVNLQIRFGEFPEDISWHLKNSNGDILHFSEPYPEGNLNTGEPSVLTGETVNYKFCLPDGDYTFEIFDSWGDGLTTGGFNVFNIGYTISSEYSVLVNSLFLGDPVDPDLGSVETNTFSVNDADYRFLGTTNQDWYEPSNWNKGSVPSKCHSGNIIIEVDCTHPGELNLLSGQNVTVIHPATITIIPE